MMKRFSMWLVAALLMISAVPAQAQNWDAVTCEELCDLVYNDGYDADQRLDGYQLINNFTHNDGYGFTSLYARNIRVDYNGVVQGFSKSGVSNLVFVNHMSNQGGETNANAVITFFSSANATKFRTQVTQLGFKKAGTERGVVVYKHSNVPLKIKENSEKYGKYPAWGFLIEKIGY